MTERDPGAERDPDEGGVPREDGAPREQRREPSLPADEEAAWAAIVAAYGEEPTADLTDLTDPADPADPKGLTHPKTLTGPGSSADPDADPGTEADPGAHASGDDDTRDKDDRPEPDGDTLTKPRQAPDEGGGSGEPPVRSFTVYAAGTGPRDWESPADDDEGHFVPPEPPPLPETDTTTKFAWVAVLGGPLLLVAAILLQADLTWWIITLGVGGFLGGFGTLVARMRDGRDEDDWDDPGRGAVV